MVRRGRVVAGDGEQRHAAAPHHQAAEGQGHRARPQGLVQVDTGGHAATVHTQMGIFSFAPIRLIIFCSFTHVLPCSTTVIYVTRLRYPWIVARLVTGH